MLSTAWAITALPALADPALTPARPNGGTVSVLVQLQGSPAARIYAETLAASKLQGVRSPTLAAVSAAKTQISQNTSEQNTFRRNLSLSGIQTTPLYSITKALNGVAYHLAASDVAKLQALPGVKSVQIIQPEYPTLSTSVPFLGTPTAWSGAAPLGVTGQNVRVGIIDTGIDYQHPTFGGTGLLADYQANNRTVAPDSYFPTPRVIGGTDLVGDAYTGGNTPVPDNDPMDCNEHGTHVASTVAGGGVNSNGTPYTGPYDGSTPFNSLRLAPGVAPQANLYAIRVFGCSGSTDVTAQAIDWSLDPNGDNDLSDHLDVINMSLGSAYGGLSDTSAVAADNAARMGVVVVASAGNSGDTYFINGSPGTGQRVISVASTNDSGETLGQIEVNSPVGIAGRYNIARSAMADNNGTPTPSGNGETANLVMASPTLACSPLTNAAAVAGKIVVIDRGTCSFFIKYDNAVNAGAIGVLVVNNVAGTPVGMSGTVANASIPAAMLAQSDGNTIKAQLASPVNATFLAAANSANLADVLSGFSSRGGISGNGIGNTKPDIAAPGSNITAARSGVISGGYAAGGQTLVLSGTSMAAPHVAGVMALLKQRFPSLSSEELKAKAMNTALHDIFDDQPHTVRVGVDRAGAGRVDPTLALQNQVLAMNEAVAGAVSLSFVGEVQGNYSQSQKLRLVNHGASSQSFDLGWDTAVDAPGISVAYPQGSSITVPAYSSITLDVQVNANASQMDHTRDPSAAAQQGGFNRHYLTNKNGFVTFKQNGTTMLRVPLYAALRPASNMHAAGPIATGGNNSGSGSLSLTGTGVCTGTLGAGPACAGSFPTTEVSRVSAFELQAKAPAKASVTPAINLQHVGVAYDPNNDLILFGLSTWGDWGTPAEVSFNISIDANSDGTFERILFNSDPGTLTNSNGQDVFVNAIYNISTQAITRGGAGLMVNRLDAGSAGSALYGNNVMILAATPAQLGLANGTTAFQYKVQACAGQNSECDTETSVLHWDYNSANQGLNFNGSHMLQDLNGSTLPVSWNKTRLSAHGSLGALLLHHHNGHGQRAEVVPLDDSANTDLAVSLSLNPAAPAQGQQVTLSLTINNLGPNPATAVQVSSLLPNGLTYVSNNGAGSYVPATGLWTVGNLAAGASQTLQVVARVTGSGNIALVARASSASVDSNPANDEASVNLQVAAQSTLSVTSTRTTAATIAGGGSADFVVQVRNSGVDPLWNLSINNSASNAGASLSMANPSTGSYSNGVWTLPSLAGGASATLGLRLTAPNMAGLLSLNSNASAQNAPSVQQSAAVTVLSPAVLSGSMTVASGSLQPGATQTYTVTLTNTGSATQFDNPGAEFTDVLPAGLSLVSASANTGTATATLGSNTVTWNGSLAPSASVTLTIVATVNANVAAGTSLSNQGSISYDADGNGSNEASALTDDPSGTGPADPTVFKVTSPALLSGLMTVHAPDPKLGSTVVYTVQLLNQGPAAQNDNPGPEFSDVLPTGLTLISASADHGVVSSLQAPSGVSLAANTVQWNGSIPANGQVTLTITAQVNSLALGQTLNNQGQLNYDADGNGTNESTAVTDDPQVQGSNNASSFAVPAAPQAAAVPTPTLSEWAMLVLMLALLGVGLQRQRRM